MNIILQNLVLSSKKTFPAVRQVLLLTWYNMLVRYRESFMGLIWVLLNPIFMISVQAFFFIKILKVRFQTDNFFLFLSLGIIIWIFLSQTIDMSATYLLYRNRIIRNFRATPPLLIISLVLENFMNFVIGFSVSFFIAFFVGPIKIYRWEILILSLLGILILSYLLGFIASVLNILYRDFKFILNYLLQLLFYITPIVYPIRFVTEEYLFLIYSNPIAISVVLLKSSLGLDQSIPFAGVILLIWLIFLATIGILIWKKSRSKIYEYLVA